MMKNTMLEMSRYAALARQAVAEGVVLLKNEAVLPLAPGGRAALFGYAQFHYYQSGTGSGGLVNADPCAEPARECWAVPDGYRLDAEVQARYVSMAGGPPLRDGHRLGAGAVVPAGNAAGRRLCPRCGPARRHGVHRHRPHGRARTRTTAITPGSFLLTEGEENMLALVCRSFQ